MIVSLMVFSPIEGVGDQVKLHAKEVTENRKGGRKEKCIMGAFFFSFPVINKVI